MGCESSGIKGLKSKEEKVQRLLVHWQENDGVDKALAQIAQEEREQELRALDTEKLQKLCTKLGVDPFVKEIMVERISKRENETGAYSRPSLVEELDAPKEEKNIDMVDSLLANEAQRKKEQEKRSQQEEALAKRRKELKALSLDDLKKRLSKKGLEASGKKEAKVCTELQAFNAKVGEAAEQKKKELEGKTISTLKEMCSKKGLALGGDKDDKID